MPCLLAAALVAVLLASGCAASSLRTFRDDGVSVRYPAEWHATRSSPEAGADECATALRVLDSLEVSPS